jgi:hypothetical protein
MADTNNRHPHYFRTRLNVIRDGTSIEGWRNFFEKIDTPHFFVTASVCCWESLPRMLRTEFNIECERFELESMHSFVMIYIVKENPLRKHIEKKEYHFNIKELVFNGDI